MKEKLTAAGSVLAAVLASSCCWGPLLLAGLGAGGAGFASALAPYRPYFIGVTFLFLAGAWYFTLRKRPAVAAASLSETSAASGGYPLAGGCAQEVQEPCCAASGARRRNIFLLAGVTAFALAMLAYPQISTVLASGRSTVPAVQRPAGPVEATTLAIQGMTCAACAVHIRQALLKVPGVVAAEVSARTASANVTFQPGRVSPKQLKQAVARAGYRVTSIRVYVVWTPILPSDRAPAPQTLSLIADNRAVHFWDAGGTLPALFHDVLGLPGGVPAWDVYLIYPPGVRWQGKPPQPTYWESQLGSVAAAPRLDGRTFAAALRRVLSTGPQALAAPLPGRHGQHRG